MSNHPTPFTPLDPGRINSMDPIELKYWVQGELLAKTSKKS